jgi:hypothetical protein
MFEDTIGEVISQCHEQGYFIQSVGEYFPRHRWWARLMRVNSGVSYLGEGATLQEAIQTAIKGDREPEYRQGYYGAHTEKWLTLFGLLDENNKLRTS